MLKPRLESTLSLGPHGFHRVAYTEWGDPENPRVVVCVHGLTRNGRDFDALADELSSDYRVVCADMPGRGRSDWLSHPADYGYPVYLADAAALLARMGAEEVAWIGTSMGGLIGMMLAAQPRSPVRCLVLNDVGPLVPKEALVRIVDYVGNDPRFRDLEEAQRYLEKVHAPFGPLTREQWRRLAERSVRRLPDGRLALHYDPAIAVPLREAPKEDVDLWPIWDSLCCSVLLFRGEASDVLPKQVAEEMTSRGPRAELVEFAGVGHAPALLDPEQVDAVKSWLRRRA